MVKRVLFICSLTQLSHFETSLQATYHRRKITCSFLSAVYHLTDVPSFVSGDYLVIFDPHASHLPGVSPSHPGQLCPLDWLWP